MPDRHLLCLLLRHERDYYWTLYDFRQDKLEAIKEDELLNLIRCSRETPVAPIDAHVIEGYAQDCRRLWLDQHPLPSHEKLERICALYLVPEAEGLSLGHLLQRQLWAS